MFKNLFKKSTSEQEIETDILNVYDPGHMIITGSQGSGKTTLLKRIIHTLAASERKPLIFLWDGSYRIYINRSHKYTTKIADDNLTLDKHVMEHVNFSSVKELELLKMVMNIANIISDRIKKGKRYYQPDIFLILEDIDFLTENTQVRKLVLDILYNLIQESEKYGLKIIALKSSITDKVLSNTDVYVLLYHSLLKKSSYKIFMCLFEEDKYEISYQIKKDTYPYIEAGIGKAFYLSPNKAIKGINTNELKIVSNQSNIELLINKKGY